MRKSRINRRKNKNDITKIASLFLISVVALAGIGVGYSAWIDTITIEGTVNTGYLSYDIVHYSETWIYKYLVDDSIVYYDYELDLVPSDHIYVAHAEAHDGIGTDYDVIMTFNNAFPCAYLTADFIFHYTGSIPVRINQMSFGYVSGYDFTPYLTYEAHPATWDDTNGVWVIDGTTDVDLGYQLHDCDYVWVGVTLHIDVNDNSMQSQTGSFGGVIELIQWNEYTPSPPPENRPPYTPSNPDPSDGATNIEPSSDFVITWDGGDPDAGDLVNYRLHWGIVPDPPFMGTIGSYNYDYSPISFTIQDFVTQYETTYYWKIIAEDDKGLTSSGPVWSFTTRPEVPPENSPPNTPSDPNPEDGATDVDINADLSWSGGDPDIGDTVTYDVYFGTSNPPSLVVSGQSGTSYDPGTMSYNTQYYWKIVAWDNHGASTEGPVWSFTTRPEFPPENSPPYEPTDPTPANNADYEDVYNVYLECTVSDPDGDPMDVSFYWGDGTFIATDSDVPNNGIASTYLPDYIDPDWLSHDTTYTWYAVANDGEDSTQGPTWNFKTCKAWDLNVDRTVDYLDISIMMGHYPETVTPPGSKPWDINDDGEADYLDLSILITYLGESY